MDHIPLRQIILDSYNQINKNRPYGLYINQEIYIYFSINKKSGSALPSPYGLLSPRGSFASVFGMGTGMSSPPSPPPRIILTVPGNRANSTFHQIRPFRSTACSALTHAHDKRLGPLERHGCAPRGACAWRPSTGCTFPGPSWNMSNGGLTPGPASRLDALSAYPSRGRLPGRGTGVPTGAP